MSMILSLKQASRSDLEALLARPEGIHHFLDPEPAVDGAVPVARSGCLPRLLGVGRGAAVPSARVVEPRPDYREADLDKAWDGLNHLLTREEDDPEALPAAFLLLGGREIGIVDVGYGPARAAMPAEVADFRRFLDGLSADELRRRYDPEAMAAAKVYPEIWSEEGDDALSYLLEAFSELRALVADTVERGLGLVIWTA